MLYNGPEADHSLSYPGRKTYSDKGGKAIKGNLIYFITNANAKVERQFDFFVADMSEGLTQAGMARLNQSIEAFIYCILGSQVHVRSSILGSSRSAEEAQREFLVLVQDAIRKPDILKSVQRFQHVIDEVKIWLDLAISPGTWFMPSNLLLNTQCMVGRERDKSFIKKKHLAVRRLNYVYNIQVIIKMDLKNHNNRNVQSNKNISHRITLC